MNKVYYVSGILLLAVALFAGVVISDQTNNAALAQDTTSEPAEEAEVDASEAITETESMTATVQAVLENIQAAEELDFVRFS